jgi:hypothetical protein
MSRSAVSCEHFASFAHFDEVSLPSKPRICTCCRRRCPRTVATRQQQRWRDRANSARIDLSCAPLRDQVPIGSG